MSGQGTGGDYDDSFNDGSAYTNITVNTSASEAKVGIDPLDVRENVLITNLGSQVVYWGTDNTVTSTTGTPLRRRQQVSIPVTANIPIFLITASGSSDVRIVELG